MITCRHCDFEVNNKMKHSLIKNACPSCGATLMGDSHVRKLEFLKSRVMAQEFAQDLRKSDVFDISWFILMEFFDSGSSSESTTEDGEDVAEPLEAELSIEDIRDEVRKEVMMDAADLPEDTEEDMRLARLKGMAKEANMHNKPGVSVRRVK